MRHLDIETLLATHRQGDTAVPCRTRDTIARRAAQDFSRYAATDILDPPHHPGLLLLFHLARGDAAIARDQSNALSPDRVLEASDFSLWPLFANIQAGYLVLSQAAAEGAAQATGPSHSACPPTPRAA